MQVKTAIELPFSKQIELINASFEGYLAGFSPMDEKVFGAFARNGGFDFASSLIAIDSDQKPAALAYSTLYAGNTRLAAMGVHPDYIGKGWGEKLLTRFIQDAKNRIHKRVLLEVFEQNIPAVNLYKKFGFKTIKCLMGYKRPSGNPGSGNQKEDIKSSLQQMIKDLPFLCPTDPPYQFSLFNMINLPGSAKCYHAEGAWIVMDEIKDNTLLIKFMNSKTQDNHQIHRLMQKILQAHPEHNCIVPQIVPEEMGESVLSPLGFERMELNQLQMELPL